MLASLLEALVAERVLAWQSHRLDHDGHANRTVKFLRIHVFRLLVLLLEGRLGLGLLSFDLSVQEHVR